MRANHSTQNGALRRSRACRAETPLSAHFAEHAARRIGPHAARANACAASFARGATPLLGSTHKSALARPNIPCEMRKSVRTTSPPLMRSTARVTSSPDALCIRLESLTILPAMPGVEATRSFGCVHPQVRSLTSLRCNAAVVPCCLAATVCVTESYAAVTVELVHTNVWHSTSLAVTASHRHADRQSRGASEPASSRSASCAVGARSARCPPSRSRARRSPSPRPCHRVVRARAEGPLEADDTAHRKRSGSSMSAGGSTAADEAATVEAS